MKASHILPLAIFSIATICGQAQSNTEKELPEIKPQPPGKFIFHPIAKEAAIRVSYESMPDSIFAAFDPINSRYMYNKKALPGIMRYGANFRYHKAAEKLMEMISNKEDFISHFKKGEYPIVISHDREDAKGKFMKNSLLTIIGIKKWQKEQKGCLDPNHLLLEGN